MAEGDSSGVWLRLFHLGEGEGEGGIAVRGRGLLFLHH